MNKIMHLLFIMAIIITGQIAKNDALAHEHKQEKTNYYTCSMHPQIKEDKPGRCPICHMMLTKVSADNDHKNHKNNHKDKKASYYTCSMHPQIKENKPGRCPICHMMLTKVSVDKEIKQNATKNAAMNDQIVAKVKLKKSQIQHFSPQIFTATTMKMNKKMRLLGEVLPVEHRESKIPAKISGRVEKVYVKSTGSLINKGDPVVDLYSPELITAGEEYLIAKKNYLQSKTKTFKNMLKRSEKKLHLLGVDKAQYQSWYKDKKVPKSITIYSGEKGVVRKKNAVVGKYFKEGENFFALSDFSKLWVQMDVYEHDAGLVDIGQEINMTFTALPKKTLTAKIDFIDPTLNLKSRTLKVRTTIDNPFGILKPGMTADATLDISLEGLPLVIPKTAIIDTGKKKIVWIKVSNNLFQAKKIQTGHQSQGYVEIKRGLKKGEKIIVEGNFLLDAQAQLFGGYKEIKNHTNKHNH